MALPSSISASVPRVTAQNLPRRKLLRNRIVPKGFCGPRPTTDTLTGHPRPGQDACSRTRLYRAGSADGLASAK